VARTIASATLLWGALLGTARAHPLLDQAQRALEAGEFDVAIEAARQAEAAQDLSRQDLVSLLALRATAHHALGQNEDALAALRLLASLEPAHVWSPATPPSIVEAYARAASGLSGPLGARIVRVLESGQLVLRLEIENDPGGLVRGTRIWVRRGARDFEAHDDRSVPQDLEGGDLGYYAEVVGLGNAILVTVGSRGAPLTLDLDQERPRTRERRGGRDRPTPHTSPRLRGSVAPEEEASGSLPWIALGVGAAAIAGAIAVILVVRPDAGIVSVDDPIFEFPVVP
jgi:hypothetical protein